MNNDGKKPRDVFREEHKALVKEGEAWLKETSQACMVVSTLIATVMFAAVFTVPVLTSRYGERDFLKSLPQKLILGFASLFVSIATMMTAFGATLVIVLNGTVTWAYIPVTLLASIPVLLFGLLRFPLFVDIVLSTYGPGIFVKKKYKNKQD
ncbi:hypothetical protein C5167_020127 [Papaver somniferum]|uniref:PGG domain-containing protein n=1 Tax=Papaver somniferum TaxID=3469 RepID=A0A4Y7IWB6_PAPSO|nr:hypothetical protein C5167_020127 [Papaver somniferum]